MLELIERCFPQQYKSEAWTSKLAEIFPAREKALESDAELYNRVSAQSDTRLELIEATSEPLATSL